MAEGPCGCSRNVHVHVNLGRMVCATLMICLSQPEGRRGWCLFVPVSGKSLELGECWSSTFPAAASASCVCTQLYVCVWNMCSASLQAEPKNGRAASASSNPGPKVSKHMGSGLALLKKAAANSG